MFTSKILTNFNPHSREGSDRARKAIMKALKNFNPHSREGSDENGALFKVIYTISIHTPAKGVTILALRSAIYGLISIHTPAKGVTLITDFAADLIMISIHTPAKGVTRCSGNQTVRCYISIHTPAKGVTNTGGISMMENVNFNPHSREGSDCFYPCLRLTFKYISIHTPAKGVTVSTVFDSVVGFVFQSTLPRRE